MQTRDSQRSNSRICSVSETGRATISGASMPTNAVKAARGSDVKATAPTWVRHVSTLDFATGNFRARSSTCTPIFDEDLDDVAIHSIE
jgi:hypothetical protein